MQAKSGACIRVVNSSRAFLRITVYFCSFGLISSTRSVALMISWRLSFLTPLGVEARRAELGLGDSGVRNIRAGVFVIWILGLLTLSVKYVCR